MMSLSENAQFLANCTQFNWVLRFTPFRETGSQCHSMSQLFFESESQKLLDRQLSIAIFICGCQHFIHGFIVPLVWIKGFQDLVQPILKKRRPPQRLKVCTRITWILWDGLVVGSTWFNPQQAPSPSLYHIVTFSFESCLCSISANFGHSFCKYASNMPWMAPANMAQICGLPEAAKNVIWCIAVFVIWWAKMAISLCSLCLPFFKVKKGAPGRCLEEENEWQTTMKKTQQNEHI